MKTNKIKSKLMSKALICFTLCGLLTAYCTLQTANCFSQAGVAINTVSANPDASAILDVSSTTQGILIPRMTDAQRNAIPSPAIGLLIYNNTTNKFNFYKSTGWYELSRTFQSAVTGTNNQEVGIAINEIGAVNDNSAILDVSSTIRGLLIPRTTSGFLTPVTGLIYYDNSMNKLRYFDGSVWKTVCETFITTTTGTGSLTSVGAAINIIGADPDPSAMLDVQSNTKGLLIPRMTNSERGQILPVTGLMVYCTTTNTIDYYNGTDWSKLDTDVPAMPGAISGTATVCQGQSGLTYFITSVSGATSYTWSVPSGASITSGQGTTSVIVTFGSTSGAVSVTANNACGASSASTLSITVNAQPSAPTLAIVNNCGNSTITASNVLAGFTWNDGGSTNPRTVTSGSYTATNTVGGCTSVASNSVTAAPIAVPSAPTLAIVNNCGNSSITASNVLAGFTWNDGGSTNPRTVTSGSHTATNTVGGCTSVASNSVTAAPIAWLCGNGCPLVITHTIGVVAPETKTVNYGTVSSTLGGTGAKCWITQNLGATNQATSADDITDAAAGWYWQFNRKRGYKSGPTPAWTISSINEASDWVAAQDPCTIELGAGWRIPTNTEWTNADATGAWNNYNDTYASVLKLHAAGDLLYSNGTLLDRSGGSFSAGYYWSSTQNDATNSRRLWSLSSWSAMGTNDKAYGFSLRCLKD
jgi:hypothetical protein